MALTVLRPAVRAIVAASSLAPCLSAAHAQTCVDHGVPINGFPRWQERATLTLTNACRIAPAAYRGAFLPSATGILQPSVYPAVPPLQFNMQLTQSARAHSTDLATTSGCGFQHNSCNGTVWSARIASYYPNYSTIGENIAAGYADPLSSLNGLILDNVGGAPSADGAPTDGHRRNIMSSSYTQLGCGYASGPNTYGRYWTQDFGRPQSNTTICSPIASASHIIQTGSVVFLSNFYDAQNAAPQSANIIVNGITSPMSIYLGAAARGTYRFSSPATASCRSYHFEFRDAAGASWRYPARGELRTFGEGPCSEDYLATTIPSCAADFDGTGTLSVADVFTYISAWFAGEARADFNHGNGLTAQDIFDYLAAWFAGC